MFCNEPNGEKNGRGEAKTVGEKNDRIKIAEGKFDDRAGKSPNGDGYEKKDISFDAGRHNSSLADLEL